jgi:hypothetical protein
MSTEKVKTNSPTWGGKRAGAGRPRGRKKKKICVSVNETNWYAALSKWTDKPSWLVDKLIFRFVSNEVLP